PELKASDLVFLALHGGDGESGQVQAFLEILGIPYTGSGPLGSGLCMDKHLSKMVLAHHGLPTPEWIMLRNHQSVQLPFDYPVVVKPNDLGSTIGLSIVELEPDVEPAIENAFQHADSVMIERFISGRELTVTILDNRALPIVEIRPKHGIYDYECKYTSGMSEYICPAEVPPDLTGEIQSLAETIFSVLKGRHYGRIDFRLDEENRPWCLEMNTLPGMTDTSLVPKAAAAANMDFNTLVNTMVKLALQ
ncbi:MAG: D-alanine--D-alanine ligase, partial [FCB group bacterium]|nr:D-alanine--D-alanine ligase [FCB group bacterium]